MVAKDILKELIEKRWESGELFTLSDVYMFVPVMSRHYPENTEMEAKIRQLLQYLRDDGYIEFIDNEGTYLKK